MRLTLHPDDPPRSLFGLPQLSGLNLQIANEDDAPQLVERVTQVLRARHRLRDDVEDDFAVRSQAEMLETLGQVTGVFKALLGSDPRAADEAAQYFQEHAPSYAAMLRPTISPTVLKAGNRYNVIPSEATATLDVRLLPDDDPARIIEELKAVIKDPSVEVRFAARDGLPRPPGQAGITTEAFRAIESAVAQNYDTVTIPAMGTGASDNAQMRAKGVQCYGMGPATDSEDAPKGFGAHSDQERILESELHRFIHFTWDIVINLARARN